MEPEVPSMGKLLDGTLVQPAAARKYGGHDPGNTGAAVRKGG
jgi:hypothetical protein